MLASYIDAAMEQAVYEIIEDERTYWGEIPGLQGVWARHATLDELINQLVSDRFVKAINYLTFAQQLDTNVVLNQVHIISRCYYAMYHAARALVLHVRRADADDHERLPAALGQVLGTNYGDTLGRWREM